MESGTQAQVEAHQPSVAVGVDGAASAWVADECNRAQGQESSPEEEGQHAELDHAGKTKEHDAWKELDVCEPRKGGDMSKQIAQTGWALKWKVVDGRKNVKARLAAKGCQGPDL